ncbi:MAG: MmcQ/YjbR family DNA-binding protein [Pseudomonadota bacterium]
MLDRPAFDALCEALPATFMVVQWGDAHVWKVGNADKNKVFAMSTFWVGKDGVDADNPRNGQHALVFKVAPMSFEMLTQKRGITQAPYMAKGQWVRVTESSPLTDEDLEAYIGQAHRIMAGGLTKKLQAELGLVDWVAGAAR